MRDNAFAHRREQAFGRFTDQDEIDAALVRVDDRARNIRNEPGRAHASIKIEDEAQFNLRHDLGIVWIAHARQAAGTEQNSVRFLA